MAERRTDIGYELKQLVFGSVHGREIHRGLSGVFDRPPHTREQECATGDSLHPDSRLCGPAVPGPPVVNECYGPRAGLTPLDVLCVFQRS